MTESQTEIGGIPTLAETQSQASTDRPREQKILVLSERAVTVSGLSVQVYEGGEDRVIFTDSTYQS